MREGFKYGHSTTLRRALALLLVVLCLFALCACGAPKTGKVPDISTSGSAEFIDGTVMTWDELKNAYDVTDTSIGDEAFYNCSSLRTITLPNSVTSIGDEAFFGCESLSAITLPDSVTRIGIYAFHECKALSEIALPDSVTSIEYGTFTSCTSLSAITIPGSVTSIGGYAFGGCTSLSTITFSEGLTSIDAEGAFAECESIKEIILPDGVTSIGYWAFIGCSSLSKVTIPESVTSIDDIACEPLTDIYFKGTVAQWNAIEKASSWDDNSREYNVHCSNGDVILAGA